MNGKLNIKTKLFLIATFILVLNQLFSQSEPITLIFAGDCTFARSFDPAIKNNFSKPFDSIPWFAEADISMVNLESCISMRGKKVSKAFNFRMHPKYLKVLENAGIDIVNLANNHIIDYGKIAMEDTFYYLDSVGIKHVGAGINLEEARKPVIFEIKGKKIGFLGYYSGNPARKNRYGTAPRYPKFIKEDIKKLKENYKVDFVIVNFHWGKEGSHYPNAEQKRIGRLTIDAGANLVIGHHPHVLQGIEHYKGGYIVYSLGNFIFGGNSRKKHNTIVFKVTIKDNQLISEIIPVHIYNFCAYELRGEKKDRILKLIKRYSKNLNKEKKKSHNKN